MRLNIRSFKRLKLLKKRGFGLDPKPLNINTMENKKNIKTEEEAKLFIFDLKSRVAKYNAIMWFIKNKGWYL